MKFISILLFLGIICFAQSDSPVSDDCRCKEIPLHGKVQVVSSFADFQVEIVGSFEDLRVEKVKAFPDECGQWQFVESFPDFTVEFVESFPDFTIRYVDAFPGID